MTGARLRLRSLPVQLVGLLTLALLPLGLISLYQTQTVLQEARSLNRASLKGRTIEAATAERALVQEALGAAQGLGAAVRAGTPEICAAVMAQFIDTHPHFIFAAFVPTDGAMTCSSSGQAMDLSESPIFLAMMEARAPSVEVTRRGAVTGQSVIAVGHPVFETGEMLGYVIISIPHRIANALMEGAETDDGLLLATVNTSGEIISATGGIDAAPSFLPRAISLKELYDRQGETFGAESGDGQDRVYAVTALEPGSVAVIGAWPQISAWDNEIRHGWMSMAFPVLMWVAGIVVAFFGVERLVIRHITALRSAMRRHALGDLKSGRLELDNPPEELADTERAFNRMVLFLAQAEAQKEQDLRDKEVLLREVHHRVKNNLQLIASIMNMQARTARTPEARRMLAGLQRRVRGLAMLHRTLYTTPEFTTVDAAELIEALVKDLTGSSAPPGMKISMTLASVPLYPDQAVPLSMLVAEALTNALKFVGEPTDGGKAQIDVSLVQEENGQARLVIENTKGRFVTPPEADEIEASGLGQKLMSAFVSQLEGRSETEDLDDLFRYTVRFTRRDFEPGRTPPEGNAQPEPT